MAFPSLQEKEKKNVSSLVEAALDEESDSEDEMEVSFTKVSPLNPQHTALERPDVLSHVRLLIQDVDNFNNLIKFLLCSRFYG